MAAYVRLLLMLVVTLAGACTVNPDPIPGGGDATTMPGEGPMHHMADATDSHDAYWPSADDLQGLPDGPPTADAPSAGDGPIEGGPDEGGLSDAVVDGVGPADAGPIDATTSDGQPDS